MRCGLYGKLPMKRDFIALAVERPFLGVWEPWLQGGVSASRLELGAAWREAFLSAPIWRFWLGADLCGTTVIGAFMPSVDGVGRYFPLTLAFAAGAGRAVPPPELDPQDGWFRSVEDVLLSALATETRFEALAEALDRLAPPLDAIDVAPPRGATRLADGTLASPADPRILPDLLAALRVEDHARAYAAATFWWTLGGEGFSPQVLVARRMPDRHSFTGMLTGRFGDSFS